MKHPNWARTLMLLWALSSFLCLALPEASLALQEEDEASENDAITLAPRVLRRQISDAEKAIKNKSYAEAVETLGKILMEEPDELDVQSEEFSQDYFLSRPPLGIVKGSVRGRAAELLESLPPESRELIELRYGVTAKQALEEAIGQYDWTAVEIVARRFFHTQAGYEATLLLSRRYLSEGKPLSAALMCERLLGSPGAVSKFGVKLALYAAECWLEAGRKDNAMRILLDANQKFAGANIDWKGKKYTFANDRIWTESDLGVVTRTPISGSLSSDWLIAGGNAQRNGDASANLTMPSPKWHTPLTRGRPDEVRLRRFLEGRNPSSPALLGAASATVVGNTIIYKTVDHALRGIDIDTGKVKWEQSLSSSPWESSPQLSMMGMDVDLSMPDQLAARVWSEVPFWQISTDGQKIFVVSKPSEADINGNNAGQLRNQFPNFALLNQNLNYLEACSIEGQGKWVWRIGGLDGEDEPKLAGAFFLGAPIPVDGILYSIANLNGETTFIAIDAETGAVQWMQQLAQNPRQNFGETDSDVASNNYLAYADGIVVCPTGTGVVVALDVSSRAFRWAFRYADTAQVGMSRGGPFNSSFRRDVDPLNERRWGGMPVVIADGRVLIASSESDQLNCLDLVTGEVLWNRRRDPYRFIGGVVDNRVLLVGDKSVVALNLNDGSLAWPAPLSLPNYNAIAGTGVRRNGSYFLPLQNQEILEIDIATGKLIGSAQAEVPLGNLLAFRDQVLSVSPFGMSLFDTQDELRKQVAQKLATDPNNPWALARSSELLSLDKAEEQSLTVLQKAFTLHPQNDEIRYLMVKSILKALESDFEKHQALADKLEPLIKLRPQRIAFLIAMTKGYMKAKSSDKAIESLLQMVNLRSKERTSKSSDPHRLIATDDKHQVDIDLWIRSQFTKLHQGMAPSDRATLENRIVQYCESTKVDDLTTRTNRLSYFIGIAPLAPFAIETASQWIDRGVGKGWLEAEAILTPYAVSTQNPHSDAARQMLERLYEAAGNKYALQNLRSFIASRSANSNLSNSAVLTESTFEIARTIDWPTTQPAVELKSAENGMFRPISSPAKLMQANSIPLAGFEVRDGSDRVVIVNPDGRESLVVNCEASDARTGSEVRMIRSFVVIQRRSEIAVIDALGDYNDAREALLWKMERFAPEVLEQSGGLSIQTRPNTLGLEITRASSRSTSVANLGPVFQHCVIVVRGNIIQALNLLNGTVLWSIDGFGNGAELLASEDKLIVLDSAAKIRRVFDAYDGSELSSQPYDTSRSFIKSYREFALDFKLESSNSAVDAITGESQKQVVIRLWNSISGDVILERPFSTNAKAGIGCNRYFAILEPTGKLHYWDLETGVESVHEIQPTNKLHHVHLFPAYDRFLLVTESSEYEIEDLDVEPKVNTSRTIFVNGKVYALDVKGGKPLWSQPGTLNLLNLARQQSRYSPIVALYRRLSWYETGTQKQESTSVALLDVRTGAIVFASNFLMLPRPESTAVESYRNPSMLHAKHGNQLLQITWTDKPASDAPITSFGEISVAKLNEAQKENRQNNPPSANSPFDIFDDIDPPNP
jgi:outer membrane protein assembly factor BamB